jgi:hypothetical protein
MTNIIKGCCNCKHYIIRYTDVDCDDCDDDFSLYEPYAEHQKPVTDRNVMSAEEYLDNNVLMIGKRFTRDDVEKFMELYAGYVAEIRQKDVACRFLEEISEEWHRDADGWKNVMNAKVPESLRLTTHQLFERWKEAQK